jgi:hypothetical protein
MCGRGRQRIVDVDRRFTAPGHTEQHLKRPQFFAVVVLAALVFVDRRLDLVRSNQSATVFARDSRTSRQRSRKRVRIMAPIGTAKPCFLRTTIARGK